MKTAEEVYADWAPDAGLWSPWVKPSFFAGITKGVLASSDVEAGPPIEIPWVLATTSGAALVLDVPGIRALRLALTLARGGFRPVPLFNCVPAPGGGGLVPTDAMQRLLVSTADDLGPIDIPADAPPCFLLDSQRMAGGRTPNPGEFDNRWMVFPQDLPSATFLAKRGIRTVLIVQETSTTVAEDLGHVVKGFRRGGLDVLVQLLDDDAPPQEAILPAGGWWKSLLFRALVTMKLRRSSAGGFGASVPTPRSGGGFFYG